MQLIKRLRKRLDRSRFGKIPRKFKNFNDAVEYLSAQPTIYLDRLGMKPEELAGKTILEIGPGDSFLVGLFFAGFGAHVTAIEKYPVKLDGQFHKQVYRAAARKLKLSYPKLNADYILAAANTGTEVPNGINLLTCGLEEISGKLKVNSIDISISNAVFEHLFDVEAAIKELSRVTVAGGIGSHQVDFRWHVDFERPLEYVTMTDEEFKRTAENCNYTCGNRLRYTDFENAFRKYGFTQKFSAGRLADPDYLDDVRKRAIPRFREMDPHALSVLGGHFLVKKSPAASKDKP